MESRGLIRWSGLLGVVSFISYAVAVIFAPLAYYGYDWTSRAVSDLSAADAPSLALWHQLSSLYGVAGMVCIMMVCVAIQGKLNKLLRLGIYIFTVMFWVSTVGFAMFPLSESGDTGTAFQDVMHIVVVALVVPLAITSFVLIMIGGYRKKSFVSLAVCASVALLLMMVGGLGTGFAPAEYFGIFQRFSNLIAVNGFLALLGIFLFSGKLQIEKV
ncbi:MAG: DUF998 domain-containing protein [Defluviitaleaceae bacterium]|nr:DUF998 domain-containing protein [Defluviitaleaceae bacterium]